MTAFLASPIGTHTYSVFLSSGSDVVALRDRVDAVFKMASDLLGLRSSSLRIDVDRWEHDAAQRAVGRVNDIFVERAKRATMTIAILIAEIRPGTLEELDAVLDQTDRQVAVLWFPETDTEPHESLKGFLEKWGHEKEKLLYSKLAGAATDEAWFGIIRLVLDFLIRAVHDRHKTELFYENV